MKRRAFIATASALICVAVTPAANAALYPCGCLQRRPGEEFDSCLVHDEDGRRWDSYTIEEIVADEDNELVTAEDDDWCCGCRRHEAGVPKGTRGVWIRTSYEYEEWDFRCADYWREDWISVQTTDWDAMARELLS